MQLPHCPLTPPLTAQRARFLMRSQTLHTQGSITEFIPQPPKGDRPWLSGT